jgi:hypothetical protein
MTIKIQRNKSPNNKIGKDIDDVLILTGTLKAQTSVENPTILIQANVADVAGCNYMTIPDFGRSYYIEDVVSVTNDTCSITGRCDPLESFKNEIWASGAIIAKSQTAAQHHLDNGLYKVRQDSWVIPKPLSGAGFGASGYVLVASGTQSTNAGE